ncbi:hypothetical protein AWR27_16125 [Spirosoma montaniterrae]|uniref:Heparinase II/III-like C-terminal domain-containing protein n=1 Tax=Spirosoma montaniterrae TaxID=1178516 RepID=A0A1P9X4F6_9BACT|nr:hypothetical protein AWR27_16125 [Spirosoma montaniterrae]
MENTTASSCFLSSLERQKIKDLIADGDPLLCQFRAALHERVYARVATKGLLGPDATTAWYYPAAEYLSDAAMLYTLEPEERLANWLRTVALDIARTSAYDWAGPAFRDHKEPLTGHLETAHLCWALAAVYDLAKDAFSESEQAEIRQALAEKGIALCRQWIAKNNHLANWRGILTSGVVVAAAVLGDQDTLDEYIPELVRCALAFQPDGSYGESLQYGNYLAYALTLGYESLCRTYPERAAQLDVSTYGRGLHWMVSSLFYQKPMGGSWGTEPRARAANFNDSAAIYRPSGDVLLHLAARSNVPDERGLARYLFETYYATVPTQGPHDLATFGMVNDWGFLTLPLLTHESQSISPKEADLPLTHSFSNGHAFLRDVWDGRTIVAINGGGDPLHGPGHLHGDLNSFILVHNRERLLVDPGHSCYRNLIHGLESSTQTHNTCTFLVEAESLGLQEDKAKATVLEQRSVLPRRLITNGVPGPPIDRGNRRLSVDRQDVVSVVGAEISQACGAPIQHFSRFWLLAGSHVLFVVDRIEASQPVTTIWNWLVNNRDGKAQVNTSNVPGATHLTVRRNEAGMKLFHGSNGTLGHPVYGYVHDAYHVEPANRGAGRPGSGLLYRWTEPAPLQTRTVVHAIALDEAHRIDTWQLRTEPNRYTLTNGHKQWTLETGTNLYRLVSGHGRVWTVASENDRWTLQY